MTDREQAGDGLVCLMNCRSELEAREICTLLEEADMPAYVFSKGGLGVDMVSGDARIGVAQVQVPAVRLEEARSIIRSVEEVSSMIDWDEVDVGEMPDEVAEVLASRGAVHALGRFVVTVGPILGILILLAVLVGIVVILAT